VLVVHASKLSYLGDWDGEYLSSRPVQANSFWDPISKITKAKWTGGVTQVVEHSLDKALSSNLSPTNKKISDPFGTNFVQERDRNLILFFYKFSQHSWRDCLYHKGYAFVKYQMAIAVWIYFKIFYSIPLVFMSVFFACLFVLFCLQYHCYFLFLWPSSVI
jgi:hypothetical protein